MPGGGGWRKLMWLPAETAFRLWESQEDEAKVTDQKEVI